MLIGRHSDTIGKDSAVAVIPTLNGMAGIDAITVIAIMVLMVAAKYAEADSRSLLASREVAAIASTGLVNGRL